MVYFISYIFEPSISCVCGFIYRFWWNKFKVIILHVYMMCDHISQQLVNSQIYWKSNKLGSNTLTGTVGWGSKLRRCTDCISTQSRDASHSETLKTKKNLWAGHCNCDFDSPGNKYWHFEKMFRRQYNLVRDFTFLKTSCSCVFLN